MKFPPKYDVSDPMIPPPVCDIVPPVGGSARAPSRVGCCEFQRPSSRSMSVSASDTSQSNRTRPVVLSVARSSGRPGTVIGVPLC